MPSFSNLSKLKHEIEKQAMKALSDDVARVVKEELQKHVLNNVYSGSSGQYYDRTYELLRSIEVGKVEKQGEGFTVQVYFNPDNSHESWWGSSTLGIGAGEQVSMTYIAQWLNEGSNMFAPQTEGFLDDAISEIEATKKHINAFISYMKTRGIIIQ